MSAKPCDPAQTSSTGGRTGSSRGPTKNPTPTTDPRVFQCPEWIPDEPPHARILRAIREAQGPITIKAICERAAVCENTLARHVGALIAEGLIVAGYVRSGSPLRVLRAYRSTP